MDHEWLAKLSIFELLLRGDGDIIHQLRNAWGGPDSFLGKIVWQAFEYLAAGVIRSALSQLKDEQNEIAAATSELLSEILACLIASIDRYIKLKDVKLGRESNSMLWNSNEEIKDN